MGNKISTGAAEGRAAVITGGASGIGLAVAKHCARLKMKVCIADLARQEKVAAGPIVQLLLDMGAPDAIFVACDVSKVEEVQTLHDTVYGRWSDCGFLFNNAGLAAGVPGHDGSFKQNLEDWKLTLDVCLYGVIHGHNVFVPTMLAQDKPAVVVNTSSAAGLYNAANSRSGPTDMAYTVAKNGVTLLTESLAAAMRSRDAPISAHVLCPFGTTSNIAVNSASEMTSFKSEESRQRYIEKVEKSFEKFKESFLSAERLAEILQECIEKGRFYCVTPDGTGNINLSRSWMLSRAEDFINDRPVLSQATKEGRPAFRELRKAVGAREAGPVHRLKGRL